MEYKLYSIAYKSKLKNKKALYTIPALNSQDAYKAGIESLIKENGDLIWEADMMTISELPQMEVKKDKNYFLKCIVDNKDKELFTAGKKYLSDNEIKYVESSLI